MTWRDAACASEARRSLLVVPVVFTYVDGFERRLRHLFHREPADTAMDFIRR
jgi:hypothetical protein